MSMLIIAGASTIPAHAGAADEDAKLPSWVRITAGLWADGKISDEAYFTAVQYLVEEGIVKGETPMSCAKAHKEAVAAIFTVAGVTTMMDESDPPDEYVRLATWHMIVAHDEGMAAFAAWDSMDCESSSEWLESHCDSDPAYGEVRCGDDTLRIFELLKIQMDATRSFYEVTDEKTPSEELRLWAGGYAPAGDGSETKPAPRATAGTAGHPGGSTRDFDLFDTTILGCGPFEGPGRVVWMDYGMQMNYSITNNAGYTATLHLSLLGLDNDGDMLTASTKKIELAPGRTANETGFTAYHPYQKGCDLQISHIRAWPGPIGGKFITDDDADEKSQDHSTSVDSDPLRDTDESTPRGAGLQCNLFCDSTGYEPAWAKNMGTTQASAKCQTISGTYSPGTRDFDWCGEYFWHVLDSLR